MKNFLILFLTAVSLTACDAPPDEPFCRSLTQKKIETKDAFGIVDIELRPNPLCMKQIGEPFCGKCVWTISEKTQYVGNHKKHCLKQKYEDKTVCQSWTDILNTAILAPIPTIAANKAYVLKMCKKNNNCNKDIARWRVKFDTLIGGE